MKIKERVGEPATESDIADFESRNGIRLPDDYKSFLGTHNGGRPENGFRVFEFEKEDGAVTESLVDWFSGLIEGEDYSLDEDLEIFLDRIPSGMLPIACDPFGNVILLGVGEDSSSGIWFWDHEIEPESISEIGIYKIADDFNQSLLGLSPLPAP